MGPVPWGRTPRHQNLAKGRSAYSQGLDRYQAINTANTATFELRVFASTLQRETLLGTLDSWRLLWTTRDPLPRKTLHSATVGCGSPMWTSSASGATRTLP